MKMRLVIEIGADGIVRVVDSTPITEHGHLQSATVDAQAKSETVVDSSYGETVKLDRNSPEFKTRKDRVERTWATNGTARKRSGASQPNANGSQTSTPAAQADWYGDATEIQLSTDDPEF